VEGTDGLERGRLPYSRPDVILPVSLGAEVSLRLEGRGHIKLFAVLEDGARCYLRNMEVRAGALILFREVREWIRVEANNGPLSFDSLCQVFGMDGAQMRMPSNGVSL
jgi:hypothetical protein